MLTNQLLIKKRQKRQQEFQGTCELHRTMCEVYKDQKGAIARNQRRSEQTNIVHESVFVDSIHRTSLAAVFPDGTCTLCVKQIPV